MGLIPRSNHLVLIKDCYPPAPSSAAPIPSPVSNGLGKLSFYAVNRPKKLPKVFNVLLERATKDRHHASGAKARQDLGVTLQIIRGLLVECGESGKDGAGELVKAVADEALKAAELALSGEGRGADKQRDPEMDAIGASLFGTVATLLTPPFFGLEQGFGKQYLRCLSYLSDLAQLRGPGSELSRSVAVEALEAAARSDILYQTANDFDMQIEHIAPALVANCHPVSAHDLRNLCTANDDERWTSRLQSAISSRKPRLISAPSTPASPLDLAAIAAPTLRLVARLSDSSQLLSLHSSISIFLNRHRGGELWHGDAQPFVEWLASSLLAASAPSYRPGVVQWWVDQVRDINDTEASHKSVTLLYVLATILRGKTDLHGLGVGGVLNTLGELLIRRAKISTSSSAHSSKPPPSPTNPVAIAISGGVALTATTASAPPNDSAFSTERHDVDCPRDRDLLTRPILSTISALASKIYYADQLENLVSDVIDLVKNLRLDESTTGASASSQEERVAAATKLVVALRLLLEEAHKTESSRTSQNLGHGEASKSTLRHSGPSTTEVQSRGASSGSPRMPPPVATADGIMLGPAALSSPGASTSGAPEDEEDVFTVRSKKEGAGSNEEPRPSIVIDSGGSSNAFSGPSGRAGSNSERNRVPPRTFEKSLFLLTVGDSVSRAEYVRAAVEYLESEVDVEAIERGSTLAPELAYFWKSLYSNCFVLATGSTPAPATSTGDQSHPLVRVRSQRSLRGLSIDSTHSSSRLGAIDTAMSGPRDGPRAVAMANDYASTRYLVEVSHSLGSATAVLEGVPMLLALDRHADDMSSNRGSDETAEQSLERAQAMREVAAHGIRQIGKTWKVREIEQLGQEALDSMMPSVLPRFGSTRSSFASRAGPAPPSLDSQSVVEALAFSDTLQTATNLDRTSLSALMGAKWSPQLASRARSSSFVSPYANGGGPSRSILQLPLTSAGRIASNTSTIHMGGSPPSRGPGSMRTPSLADLQSSLGGGGGGSPSIGTRSARQSQTPSLSSVNGGGGRATGSSSVLTMATTADASPTKRRTTKMSPEMLLASVGRRGRATTTSSSLSSQL